jgi:single-stranded DNA-binding protein
VDDINSVHLTGTVERDAVKHHEGTPMVGFTIRVDEVNRASGELFKVYVPIETYGATADQAQALRAGDAVLIGGKLKWTSWTGKDGQKKSSLAVLARLVKVIGASQQQAKTQEA